MDKVEVSVIIPVFNGEKYLETALRCLKRQTFRNFEIIAVDDGSTDGTAGIVARHGGVVSVSQPNRGVASARNVGIATASGDLIAFLDVDDLWQIDKLALQVGHMKTYPEWGYCITKHRLFKDKSLAEVPVWVRKEAFTEDTDCYLPSSLMVRRTVFNTVGVFAEEFRQGEDSDWFFRVKDSGIPMGIIDRTLVYKRVHEQNLTGQVTSGHNFLLAAISRSIIRKRDSICSIS